MGNSVGNPFPLIFCWLVILGTHHNCKTSEASPCAAAACFARRRRAAPLVADRSGTGFGAGATLAGLSLRFLRRFWILEVGILESFQLLACYTFKYINKSQLAGHKDAQSFVLKAFSCRFLLDLVRSQV